MRISPLPVFACSLFALLGCGEDQRSTQEILRDSTDGTVIFDGGYQTVPQDGGRPVRLIAAALNVEEQVFRDAFSGVTPSRVGPPTPSHARANKKVLMDALGKHGVTNERLDEVSNYYRYQPGPGELWTHTPATATATVQDGKVTSIEITNPGSGYMQPPKVIIAGHEDVEVSAEIEFTTDLETNGRLKSVKIVGLDTAS